MKLTTMTILIAVFSAVQIFRIIVRIRQEKIGLRSALMWIFIWLTIGFASIFPSFMDYFMQIAQMVDRMIFILLLAVFILFALVFTLTWKLEKLQRDHAKMIQELALLRSRSDPDDTEKRTSTAKSFP